MVMWQVFKALKIKEKITDQKMINL